MSHIPYLWKSKITRSFGGGFIGHARLGIIHAHYVTGLYTYRGIFIQFWKWMIEFHIGWGPYKKRKLFILRIGLDYSDYLNWKLQRILSGKTWKQRANIKRLFESLK